MMTENLSQLINFFANEERPYLFNRFFNTLAGLRSVENWHHYYWVQAHFKQLCWGFAGHLQLPIKVLNQTGYAMYIQSSNSKFLDRIRTILQIRRKPKYELNGGPDSFPVAPEVVLTRTRCIKGRPHENRGAFTFLSPFPACPATLTSFLPSLSLPLKNK